MKISDEEFMRRLRARFIEAAGEEAGEAADGCDVEVWRENFEDNPEDAANEEMSYWEDGE